MEPAASWSHPQAVRIVSVCATQPRVLRCAAPFPLAAAGMVAKARSLAAAYSAAGVPPSRLLLRLPATWEGCCAARELQAGGLDVQMSLVYRLAGKKSAGRCGPG
jgi:transaldolase